MTPILLARPMPMPEPLTPAQKWDTFFRTAMATIDEAVGMLKLFFALNTGAVALFVNLLARLHERRLVLIPLDISIFSFGLAAVLTINAYGSLVEFRSNIANMMANEAQGVPDWNQLFSKNNDRWKKKFRRVAKWMGWLFNLGIVFAGVFVLAITFAH